MIKVIGVRFRTAGKIYFFDPLAFDIKRGDHVIVETARGIEYGTVMSGPREVAEDKVVQPLKPVIRMANERDAEQERANRQKEKEALQICLEKIQKHGLEMKLIDAEYTFDNNKVLFYFTADGRIDFRELVKDLASVFKTRIELRQIGVRDETKLLGGIGICGRPLCCHSYLSDFVPVSIKMAKEQNLSLNPTKISGVCGRLMCCLKNEEETYEELNRRLPNIGDTVTAEDGTKGVVQSVNVLRQLVKVIVEEGDEKTIHEYEVGKLHFKRKHTKKERMELSPEELEELERLEQEEIEEIQGMQEGRSGAQDSRQKERPGRRERNGRNGRGSQESTAEGQTIGNGQSARVEAAVEQAVRIDTADDKVAAVGQSDQEGYDERGERGRRGNRSDRSDRGNRNERNNRNDGSDRADRGNRGGGSERPDRGSRNERNNNRGDGAQRNERNNRKEWNDRDNRGDGNAHGERGNWNDRTERRQNGRKDFGDRNKKNEQNDRFEERGFRRDRKHRPEKRADGSRNGVAGLDAGNNGSQSEK